MEALVRRRSSRIAAVLAASALGFGAAAVPASAQQTGLVNVNIEDNQIQVPIAVAANICDVDINVLAVDLGQDGSATCTADNDQTVTANRGNR